MNASRVAQHLLISCLILVSLASCLQGNLWNGNDYQVSPTCDVKKEISKLEGLITDLEYMKKELQKCVSKCSEALLFGGSTNEYAKYVSDGDSVTDRRLDAMTSCFWIKTEKKTEEPAVLSYAVPGRDNEFLIHLQSNMVVAFKTTHTAGDEFFTGVGVSDGQWHHVCITWKSDNGRVNVFKDGIAQIDKTGIITGQQISPSGTWIIGQDQDRVGGDFEKRNAFHGSLTDVNVWNRVLDACEIFTLANQKCGLGMQGNYIAYKDFARPGDVQLVKPSCCL